MVTVTKAARAYIAKNHPLEYAAMMAALPGLIANPAFIGRTPSTTTPIICLTRLRLRARPTQRSQSASRCRPEAPTGKKRLWVRGEAIHQPREGWSRRTFVTGRGRTKALPQSDLSTLPTVISRPKPLPTGEVGVWGGGSHLSNCSLKA